MNISNVTRDTTLQALQSTAATSSLTDTDPLTGTTSSDDASTVQLSQPGELFKKLSDLSQSDPAAFKATVQKISDSLKTEAANADPQDAARLNKLSDAFAQAAQTGDLSPLKQQHHGGHGGHHHHGGGDSTGGVVSAQNSQAAGAQRAYSAANASPPAPSQTLEDAFASALSIVNDALSSSSTAAA
ncbi:MAG TPA: hypothetical protein VGI70_21875 [Polyangiales bacterium]|jgi:hypothetical protein